MFKAKWARDYLVFNRKDRIGASFFVVVVAGSILVPRLLSGNNQPRALAEDPALVKAMDTLQKAQQLNSGYGKSSEEERRTNYYRYEPSQSVPFTEGQLFQFDPNAIKAADWQRMGLNEKTSKTIEKYVSKGGKFYKPEDLLRIWGMPEGFYNRVKDYVVITSLQKNYPSNFENKTFVREERKPLTIGVNTADTSALIALPGIGGKLSARIIAFRERLGGFYSIEQIGETYGLPDSTFQKIKGRLLIDGEVRKINVNTATKDELKIHPYIKWNLANAIVEYRNQHGSFKSFDELKNIALVDEATYNKIIHYLEL